MPLANPKDIPDTVPDIGDASGAGTSSSNPNVPAREGASKAAAAPEAKTTEEYKKEKLAELRLLLELNLNYKSETTQQQTQGKKERAFEWVPPAKTEGATSSKPVEEAESEEEAFLRNLAKFSCLVSGHHIGNFGMQDAPSFDPPPLPSLPAGAKMKIRTAEELIKALDDDDVIEIESEGDDGGSSDSSFEIVDLKDVKISDE